MFDDIGHWYATRDGDPRILAIFNRHYSRYVYADGRQQDRIVGPGERMVLLTSHADALFVWRHCDRPDMGGRTGTNCSVFRNESAILSSTLIHEAMALAWARWPHDRLYTFVNPRKVASANPGYCFKVAGWSQLQALTKERKLIELECWPV
jgi:hypothetical protein